MKCLCTLYGYIVILCIRDIEQRTVFTCIALVQVVVGTHQYTRLHAIRVMGYDMYGTSVYTYFSTVVEDKMILPIFFVAGLRNLSSCRSKIYVRFVSYNLNKIYIARSTLLV